MEYTVDASNRIIAVDDEWDTAAVSSVSGGPVAATIVGRPLDEFLVGDATKMFVRSALDAARLLGETRVLPYRCDSPAERRLYEMLISPLNDGLVKVEHRLVSSEARPLRRSVSPPRARTGWRCSQCLAVRLTGTSEWVEDDRFVPLAQDVCPSCARRLFESPASHSAQHHE
jgi:hypothetical protein